MSPTGSGGATGVGFAVLAMPSKSATGADTTSGCATADCSAPSPVYPVSAGTGPRCSTGRPTRGCTVAARWASADSGGDVSAAAATVNRAVGSARGGTSGAAAAGRDGTATSATSTATTEAAAVPRLCTTNMKPPLDIPAGATATSRGPYRRAEATIDGGGCFVHHPTVCAAG